MYAIQSRIHTQMYKHTDAWPPHLNLLTPKQKYSTHTQKHTHIQYVQVCAHEHTPVVSGQHTQNSLVFELSVPLKVSAAFEEDLTDRENTHVHTRTHTAMSTLLEQKTWLSWISPCSPFLFSICLSVGEPVWGKIMPTIHTPRFTFSAFAVTLLYTHTLLIHSANLYGFPLLSIHWCLSMQPFSILLHSFFQFPQLQPYLFWVPYLLHLSSSLPPSLCRLCGAVWLTNSQRETSAGVPAKLACLSAQITWDSPNYPVANQSISWVSAGDACPPFAVVTGGVIRRLFYCNPKNVPAGRIHATGSTTATFQ